MIYFSKVLRTLSLAILSGGGVAIIFTAVVLIKAATARGIPIAEAAAANAPIFINFSQIALIAAFSLAFGEFMDWIAIKQCTKLRLIRTVASIICIAAMFYFSIAIVPALTALLPTITLSTAAHEQFHHLHEMSRVIFGISIFCAFISLIISTFESHSSIKSQTDRVVDASGTGTIS